jgi:hypothetical protein
VTPDITHREQITFIKLNGTPAHELLESSKNKNPDLHKSLLDAMIKWKVKAKVMPRVMR